MELNVSNGLGKVSYSFEGARVLITGGARGQGLSHAMAFARAGASVAIWDVPKSIGNVDYGLSTTQDLDNAAAKLKEYGSSIIAAEVDVTSADAVKIGMQEVRAQFGGLDILVNNAGINQLKAIESLSLDDWNQMLSVNLTSAYLCARESLDLMAKSGGGLIINVSSLAAMKGGSFQAHYISSKTALLGMTRALAVELAPKNIRVNAICPSLVLSPMSLGLSTSSGRFPVGRSLIPSLSALTTDHITNVVLWICSSAASIFTGFVIPIDMGNLLV